MNDVIDTIVKKQMCDSAIMRKENAFEDWNCSLHQTNRCFDRFWM